MKRTIRGMLGVLALGLLAACSDRLIVDRDWMPRHIIGHISKIGPGVYGEKRSTIKFRNGREISSDVVDLQFIGQLPTRDNPPFLILSGRRCYKCESNPSIYIHAPGDGRMSKRTTRYRYPGRLYSHLNGQLIEEARFFYGECLPGRSQSTAVWFVRTRRDTRDWQDITILAETFGNDLKREEFTDPPLSIEPTLTLVEEKRCRELPGRQMNSEP